MGLGAHEGGRSGEKGWRWCRKRRTKRGGEGPNDLGFGDRWFVHDFI
jgi:hypothetical protein